MTNFRIKGPRARPIDSRDRLPTGSEEVLVYVKGGKGHWVKLRGQDVRMLHRFSSGPVYWAPLSKTS